MRSRSEIATIIAHRVDTGARVNIRNLAAELGEDVHDVRAAYRALAQQRGHDPVLERSYRRLERMRARAGLPALR